MILLFLVSVSFLVSSEAYRNPHFKSAASQGQIKFAIENKYDDTGPGAKQPPAAYKTYNNLEHALIGYLDDPDTKLPENERNKLFKPLILGESPKFTHNLFKPLKLEQGPNPLVLNSIRNVFPHKTTDVLDTVGKFGSIPKSQDELSKHLAQQLNGKNPGWKYPKIGLPPIKLTAFEDAPRTLNHLRDSLDIGKFDTRPHYSYSYGIHDHHTGDAKSAHESRDGGRVRGYYTVLDADGQQRTVHYTADDRQGFRATVQRTPFHSAPQIQ